MSAVRKGASKRADIPAEILQQLNRGEIESATLVEGLAIDFSTLIQTLPIHLSSSQLDSLTKASNQGITKRMALAASILMESNVEVALLRQHHADTVRGWAAFAIGLDKRLSLEEKLHAIRSLADDAHFGVREWAWLAIRGDICDAPQQALKLLMPWATHDSDNTRRFAIEATRPRGVWAKHITELKQQPEIAESLLNSVMEDPSRYVQDSCANWINDAAKTQPEWARGFCLRWQGQGNSAALRYVIKRSLRSIK